MNRPFDSEAIIARIAEVRPQVVELAEIVSLAVSVDRRLLRQARRALTKARPEAEADLYFSELVQDRNPARFVFHPEAAMALRRRLAAQPERLERAWALVSARHGRLPATLRTEELLQWHALRGDTAAVRDLLRTCVSTLVQQGRQGFAAWAIDAVARLDPAVRAHEEYRMLGLGAAMRTGARPQQLAELADDRLGEWLEWLAPESGERTELGFSLVEGGIEFGPAGDPRYSQKISLPGRFPQMLDIREAGGRSHVLNLRSAAPTVLETASKDLVITAEDGTRLRVRPPGQRFVNANRTPRVHITYDVETYGAKQSIELPYVIGVLGDFAGAAGKRPPLEERHFREIDADNFDRVMAQIAPQVRIAVPNEIAAYGMLECDLRFETMADFSPDTIVRKVSQLDNLMLARDSLRDLAAELDGKDAAQDMVTAILTDRRMVLAMANQVPSQRERRLDQARREARRLFLRSDTDKAVRFILEILSEGGEPKTLSDKMLLIDCIMQAGVWRKASEMALALISDLAEQQPENQLLLAEVNAWAARSLKGSGEYAGAEVHYRLAIRHLAHADVDAHELTYEIRYELAQVLERLYRKDEAETEWRQAIEHYERATGKEFFPHQKLTQERRDPSRKTSIEVLRDNAVGDTFRPRSEEQKARILNGITELCALVADEPLLNFGDPFNTIESVIDWLDALIGKQINHILADPGFQRLESTWRGLDYLVSQTGSGKYLKIKLFDVVREELHEASECNQYILPEAPQGKLYYEIYDTPFSTVGASPFSVILCDFTFADGADDLFILKQLAHFGEIARVTFIASAGPQAIGLERWEEIQVPRDIPPDRLTLSGDNAATQAFRESDASRSIALTMPPIVGRAPYRNRSNPVESFTFDEDAPPLTISAIWPLGLCLARAFDEYGWLARTSGVEGGGLLENLPLATFEPDSAPRIMQATITDRRAIALAEAGLIPLVKRAFTDSATFFSLPTLHNKAETKDERWSNARRALKLELTHARFAHYLMCLQRDQPNLADGDLQEMQNLMNDWLQQYVTPDDALDDASERRALLPLLAGSVSLSEAPGLPNTIRATLDIIPAYQFEGVLHPVSRNFLAFVHDAASP